MFNGKFLFTIVGIVLAIMAVSNVDTSQPIIENWMGMGAQTTVAAAEVQASNGRRTMLPGSYFDPNPQKMRGSGTFFSVPSFQANISPRMSNVQYGANIRSNPPDMKNMAASCDPMSFGDMATENYKKPATRENYCGSGQCGSSVVSCGKGNYGLGHRVEGGEEVQPGYTNGNYMDVYNSLPSASSWRSQACDSEQNNSASLPVGTMSSMDAMGNSEQFVVMNRYMNVNQKSRLRSLGDNIRGDLPITPCTGQWFNVNPRLNVDLNAGALNVMNGNGDTTLALSDLLVKSSGGARTTFGGVDVASMKASAYNMTPSFSSSASNGGTDIVATAFP
jgi:hypothetical protein